ncbi:class I SAM-dependent methyltransferase [Inediibacterium massiliense]|uniref:class I SAM-dependent methyltransferase n=1 Tax=Inediibacterium massiliense TaxID=1658111 RepID=UPI0006B4BE6F|nr:rRNA adenine N-6-methyltransferase family protein [Inediibacterium massiliense]
MEWKNFIKQYIKNPRTVGAIAPSSKKLAYKMIEDINFFNTACIVEYGPGTGVFTEKILENKKDETVFIAIEYNKDFYEILKNKFRDKKNFILINDSVENLKEHLHQYNIEQVDYIVSGIPFASLPEAMSENILAITKDILSREGNFITFQYTLLKEQLFRDYFRNIKRKKVLINLPPAYVLECQKF